MRPKNYFVEPTIPEMVRKVTKKLCMKLSEVDIDTDDLFIYQGDVWVRSPSTRYSMEQFLGTAYLACYVAVKDQQPLQHMHNGLSLNDVSVLLWLPGGKITRLTNSNFASIKLVD